MHNEGQLFLLSLEWIRVVISARSGGDTTMRRDKTVKLSTKWMIQHYFGTILAVGTNLVEIVGYIGNLTQGVVAVVIGHHCCCCSYV